MNRAVRFPFRDLDPNKAETVELPVLPLTLRYEGRVLEVDGLLDTGSTVNVLPYTAGTSLGATWDPLGLPLELSGNLARFEARPLVVTGRVADFPPVRLAFAWTKSDITPIILGQVIFFLEFDVCLFRSLGRFEVRPKAVDEEPLPKG